MRRCSVESTAPLQGGAGVTDGPGCPVDEEWLTRWLLGGDVSATCSQTSWESWAEEPWPHLGSQLTSLFKASRGVFPLQIQKCF